MVETKETAAASAERRADIAAGLRRLPTFLRELRPTMAALGDASEAQTPALANLNASADQLATFLENLKPLSESTQVNLRSLAEASRKGRPAVKAAQPVVAELNQGTKNAPELANNSAIVFEHLNDRKNAVEKDPRSPGGEGYTGFEAVLQWLFDQSQAINIYDKNGYILKVNLFHSKCSEYQNPKTLKEHMAEDPSFYKDCAAILGPNQPSITTPDPTAKGNQFSEGHGPAPANSKSESKSSKPDAKQPDAPEQVKGPVDEVKKKLDKDELRKRAIERLRDALEKGNQDVGKLRKRLEDRLGIELPAPDKLPEAPPSSPAPSIPTPTFPTPGRLRPERAQRAEPGRHRPTPRLPARAMRKTGAGIASNPVLVGGVTILVVIVAVFLSYNANQGLPFVPTTQLKRARAQRRQPRAGQRDPLGRQPRRRDRRHEARARSRRQGRGRALAQARQAHRRRAAGLDLPHPRALRARPEVPRAQRGPQRQGVRERGHGARRPGQRLDGHRRVPEDVRRRDPQGQPGEPARLRRRVRGPRPVARAHDRGAAQRCSSTCSP